MLGLLGSLLRGEPGPPPPTPSPRTPLAALDPTVEALRAKERFLSTLLDNLPGFAYRCRNDRAWTVEFISEGVRKVTGYAPDDFLQGRISFGLDLIHPDHRGRIWHAVQEALARGEVFQFSYPVTTADGHVRWMWEQGRAVHGCHGTFEALEGFVTDVTDRVLAEQALHESDRVLESAQEVAHVGSWSHELAKSATLHWSAEMRRIFGLQLEEFDGRLDTFFAMVHPGDQELVRAAHASLLREAGTFDLEHRIVRRDGAVRWVHNRAQLVSDERGRTRHIAGVCQDITEHKELRARLGRAQTMEALGRLAGGIAHDFNNLLQVIESCTGIMLGDADLAEPQRMELAQIRQAGEQAGRLTQQLLALGRRQPLSPRAVDVCELVAGLLPGLESEWGPAVTFEFAPAAASTVVLADTELLEQVVRGLCAHSCTHLPAGGRLCLRTEWWEPDARFRRAHAWARDERYAVLSITDQARAIQASELERIFEPFSPAGGGQREGGLGLAALHGIVTQHGGSIEVESSVGAGTSFHVYLPAAVDRAAGGTGRVAGVAPGAAGGAVPTSNPARATILLAEDDRLVSDLHSRVLRAAGYEVLVAHDGGQALQLFDFRRGHVDVIVLDMVMPVLDGGRVRAEIAKRDPGARFVLTSGYSADALPDTAGASPAGFLQKPYPPERLLAAIREALGTPVPVA